MIDGSLYLSGCCFLTENEEVEQMLGLSKGLLASYVPGSTLRELVHLEASRAAIAVVSQTGSYHLEIPGKAPIQEEPSSCQPARVSPESTMQAEGGSCLGKVWSSEAVSSFLACN